MRRHPSVPQLTRREFLLASAAASGIVFAAACAPQPTSTGTQPAAPEAPSAAPQPQPTVPPATEPVAISFWYYWSGIWSDACTAVANKFTEDHPDIKVEPTTTNAQWEKVLAAFAAGAPPDVLLDFTGSQLMPRKQVMALDDLIASGSGIKPDNYFPAMLDSFKWQGAQYGLPAAEAGVDLALIINKGLAETAGLDVAKPPETITEMLDWAEKMTIMGEGDILAQIGFDPLDGTSSQGYYNWSACYGKNWWDPTTQKFDWLSLADAFKWQAAWMQKWGPANFEAFRKGFGGWLEPDSSMCLGKQGLHINGYWTPGELLHKAAEGQEFIYAWAPVPDARRGVKYQTSVPTGIFLPLPAKNSESAFQFLAYVCSDDANAVFYDTAGGFAWTKSWLAKVDTSKYPGLDFYVKSIADADELYCNVQNCPLGFQFPQDQYLIALNGVIYDGKEPEAVLAEAQKVCEEELAKLLRG